MSARVGTGAGERRAFPERINLFKKENFQVTSGTIWKCKICAFFLYLKFLKTLFIRRGEMVQTQMFSELEEK